MRQSGYSHRLRTTHRHLRVPQKVQAALGGEAPVQAIHNETTILFATLRIAHWKRALCNSHIGNDGESFERISFYFIRLASNGRPASDAGDGSPDLDMASLQCRSTDRNTQYRYIDDVRPAAG